MRDQRRGRFGRQGQGSRFRRRGGNSWGEQIFLSVHIMVVGRFTGMLDAGAWWWNSSWV